MLMRANLGGTIPDELVEAHRKAAATAAAWMIRTAHGAPPAPPANYCLRHVRASNFVETSRGDGLVAIVIHES